MTGKELIATIKNNGLEDCRIIPNNLFNPNDGEYLRFETNESDVDYAVLWLTDDYFQDVVYCHAGEITYGLFSKAEKDFFVNAMLKLRDK